LLCQLYIVQFAQPCRIQRWHPKISLKINQHREINQAAQLLVHPKHTQSSRKGKKAWRKNLEVEQGLEGLRQEEGVTGYSNIFLFFFLIDSFLI
jgi:hypothetical protein